MQVETKKSFWADIKARLDAKKYRERSKIIKHRRKQLSNMIDEQLDGTVAYGPFKGLKLARSSSWGSNDRASMLLGLYEQELLDEIETLPVHFRVFIDLGAADGYYGIGSLINNRFDTSYCFEMSELGRDVIRETAETNGVAHRATILGKAEKDFAKHIKPDDLAKAVLFVDIEGGEFDVLDTETFAAFRNSIIFIELHEWLVENGDEKLRKLREDASAFFDIKEITTTSRNPSAYPELRALQDTDRWLICSEGRGRLMTWYRLDPKS